MTEKAGLAPENITIQDKQWQYYDILPGQDGHDFGDAYLLDDKMYIYLGSGIGEPLAGAVAEVTYAGIPLLSICFFWKIKKMQKVKTL